MANRKSSRAFQRAIDGVRTLLISLPKGGSKTDFSVFQNKIQFQYNKVCYKVSLRKTFHRQSCRAVNHLWNNRQCRTESVSFHLKYWLKLTYPVVGSAAHAVSTAEWCDV